MESRVSDTFLVGSTQSQLTLTGVINFKGKKFLMVDVNFYSIVAVFPRKNKQTFINVFRIDR